MVLFAHVTSHVEGDAYQNLLSEKGGRGFPFLAILDANGDVVAKPASRDVAGFEAALADGAKFLELKAKEKPTLDERVDLLCLEIALGRLDLEKAREAAAGIEGMTDVQKAKVADAILPLEIRSHMPKSRRPTPEERQASGKAFAEMFKAGREPTDLQTLQPFFILMLDYAEAEKDADLFKKALGRLEAAFADNPRATRFLDAQRARLEKLESEKKEGD